MASNAPTSNGVSMQQRGVRTICKFKKPCIVGMEAAKKITGFVKSFPGDLPQKLVIRVQPLGKTICTDKSHGKNQR